MAFSLSPPARRRQSPAWRDQDHLQRHRLPEPDYPQTNSLPAARETKCSDCGHRQRQSASSNPPAESLENHIIEGVFTQSGPDSDIGRIEILQCGEPWFGSCQSAAM